VSDDPGPIPLTPTASLVQGLQLTLWIAAAVGDASNEQMDRLRERLEGELARHRLVDNSDGIRRAVLEIMGAAWEPTGDHRAQLESLGWAP
jgi:hypothetical protein